MSEATVLIPFLNGGNEEWLQQAVDSFGKNTPVLVLRNDGEMAAAMNRGLEQATTEFVIPFGADDLATPGYIDMLMGPAWNADVVYPTMRLVSEDLSQFIGDYAPDPFDGRRLLDWNFVSGASLVRRSKALEVGGWRQVETMEDWDLFVRIYRAGGRFKPCPEAMMFYRQVEASLNKRKSHQDEEWLKKFKKSVVGDVDPLADAKATFYYGAMPATTYLRCQLPARYLPGVCRSGAMAAMSGDEVQFPEHRGAGVFQFAADKTRAAVILAMRNEGIRTLVEVDDNYLIDPGKRTLDRSRWGMKIGEAQNTRQGHRWIVENSDGVIVTTQTLADAYREVTPNVYVCPNTVDPPDWPDPVKPDDGILRIAWFASQSHEGDIGLVRSAYEWASRQKDVEVYIVNLNPAQHHSKAVRLRWNFKYGYLPWMQDLDQYRDSFKYFDIGVAPITSTPMGLGRSDVKALEMAMGLQCPVLSDVAPYSDWVDGTNCLKAKDSQGFLKAIKHLVGNRDEVKQLAQAARDYTLAERTTEAQVHLWREAVE